jgi:predicted membrane chloride channel (bestrophin family)
MANDPATINKQSTNENNTDVDRWVDARKLRALMDQQANIKRNYHTTTPERQRALETIFGADVLQDTNNSLDSLSLFMTRLSDSRDEALRGE